MNQFFTKCVDFLQNASKAVAVFVCFEILFAATMIVFNLTEQLFTSNIKNSIQEGLFVLILLEMFYVIRSYVKYGTINIGLVVNIGVIATAKAIIFNLESMTLSMAISFSILLLSLALTYLIESFHFRTKNKNMLLKKNPEYIPPRDQFMTK